MTKGVRASVLWLGALMMVGGLMCGCGGAKHPVVPVKGRVVFEDGKPLPVGTRIILEPVDPDRKPATGEVKDDGSFELKHSAGANGAEIGKYRVRIAAPANDSQNFFQMVPESYAEGNELMLEVKPDSTEVTLKVRRKNPS
jgi:hypothetical protein